MKAHAASENRATLRLSDWEMTGINNALNTVLNYLDVDVRGVLAMSREAVATLLLRLEPELTVSRTELAALQNAIEVSLGSLEEDFHPLMGIDREEATTLSNEIGDLLRTLGSRSPAAT